MRVFIENTICEDCLGIIGLFRDFLAFNLAKYQYFSMGLSLFDKIYLEIWILWPKNLKNDTKSAVSPFAHFALSRSLILLLLLHFSIFLLLKLASQLNLAAILLIGFLTSNCSTLLFPAVLL